MVDPGGDPLIGFHYGVDVDGVLNGYFTEVDGIGSESAVVEQKVVDKLGNTIIRKLPGQLRFLDVTLKRGITANRDIWDWRAMVENGDVKSAQKSVTITMFDQTPRTRSARGIAGGRPARGAV